MALRERTNFGWIPDLPDFRDKVLQLPMGLMAPELPASVDLSKLHKFHVKDQGELGSCVLNATASAIEFARAMRPHDPKAPGYVAGERNIALSRLFLYYEARRPLGTLDQDSGCNIRDALRVAYNIGAALERSCKYDVSKFKNPPSKRSYDTAPLHKITSYVSVPVSVQGVKTALSLGSPVIFGVNVYSSFMNPTGEIQFPELNEELLGGHAMLCTGYDDTTQRFNFLNSWGESWGNKGYGTIPYNYLGNPRLGDDYWVVTDDQFKERM